MICFVAADEVMAFDVFHVVEIVGRRHAGETSEFLVQVGVVGESQLIDELSEVFAFHIQDSP